MDQIIGVPVVLYTYICRVKKNVKHTPVNGNLTTVTGAVSNLYAYYYTHSICD